MRTAKDAKVDAVTKKAWEKNWENISMEEILEIFKYVRVKKQMELFRRVLPKTGKILEGGCGLSPYLITLRREGYDIEGIDYNEAPLKKALAYDPTLPLKVGDVANIPYSDNYFDGYISLGVIEHFTEGPQKAVRDAWRVLKPGGVFVVFVPQSTIFMKIAWPMRFIKSRRFLRRILKKSEENHYWEQYFKKEELKGMLEKEGFEVREMYALDHSHAVQTSCTIFRDKDTLDEANALGLRVADWCEKNLKWQTCATLALICYKKEKPAPR